MSEADGAASLATGTRAGATTEASLDIKDPTEPAESAEEDE